MVDCLEFDENFSFDFDVVEPSKPRLAIINELSSGTSIVNSGNAFTLEEIIKQKRASLQHKQCSVLIGSASEKMDGHLLSSDDDVDCDNNYDLQAITFDEPNAAPQLVTIVREDTIRDINSSVKKKPLSEDAEENDKFSFHEEVLDAQNLESFIELRLCKPLLKALIEMQLVKPTPIQAATVPIALQHRDICACARTGSGKTIAFLAPIINRLAVVQQLTRSHQHATRALIMSPTRELAFQIYEVTLKLIRFLPNITVHFMAGGHDRKDQEAALKMSPDIIIATPGRLIDHLHNTMGFHLKSIQFLVLDEADKMLDDYFDEQIKEIVRMCNRERQTILLSATMTESVRELAAASLKNPVKIFLHSATEVALRLSQEFVRVRPQRESDREAMLVSLIMRWFPKNSLVFLPTKKLCHRMHVILGLLGCVCGEIHSDLAQYERNRAIERFKSGEIDILLATDLLARGMDLDCVETVINYSLPSTLKQYIHRVGRTARAGRSGRSITLVGEEERRVMKEVKRTAHDKLKARVIKPEVIEDFKKKLDALESDVADVLRLEKENRALSRASVALMRAEQRIQEQAAKKDQTAEVPRYDWFKEKEMKDRKRALKDQKDHSEPKKKKKDRDRDMWVVLGRRDRRDAKIGYFKKQKKK